MNVHTYLSDNMTPKMEEAILKELHDIKKDVIVIKSFILDEDMVLSKKEKKMVDEAIDEHKKGKTISLREVEKRLTM